MAMAYIMKEETWNRAFDAIQALAFVQTVANGSNDRTQLEITSDEFSAFIGLIRRELEPLQNLPYQKVETQQ